MASALSARRPGAGAVPGRWGACLVVRTPPAAFVPTSRPLKRWSVFLLVDPQQLRGLGAERGQLFEVSRGVAFERPQPAGRPVVIVPGPRGLAQSGVAHGQEVQVG